jgi:hypothetical protein
MRDIRVLGESAVESSLIILQLEKLFYPECGEYDRFFVFWDWVLRFVGSAACDRSWDGQSDFPG